MEACKVIIQYDRSFCQNCVLSDDWHGFGDFGNLQITFGQSLQEQLTSRPHGDDLEMWLEAVVVWALIY